MPNPILTYAEAATMSEEEKFDLLRSAVAFSSNTAPYALTDAEESVLSEFLTDLAERRATAPRTASSS